MSRVNRSFRGSKCAVILTAVAASAISAEAAFIPISVCDITNTPPIGSLISVQGDYEVVAPLTLGPTTECILITTSGVSLKLNGFQINAVNNGAAGILVSNVPSRLSNVYIEGPGLITNFQNGIVFVGVDNSQIDLVTAVSNTANGIRATGSTFLTIGSNVLDQNGLWGLLLQDCSGVTVENNEASGNGSKGVAGANVGGIGVRLGSTANSVTNNRASVNGPTSVVPAIAAGIDIAGNSNRVYGNTTNGNILAGIQVELGSGGNSIFSNPSSVGNLKWDMEDDNLAPPCGTDAWSSNVFFTANQTCIH